MQIPIYIIKFDQRHGYHLKAEIMMITNLSLSNHFIVYQLQHMDNYINH